MKNTSATIFTRLSLIGGTGRFLKTHDPDALPAGSGSATWQ